MKEETQTVFRCEDCNRRFLTKAGATKHERDYCRKASNQCWTCVHFYLGDYYSGGPCWPEDGQPVEYPGCLKTEEDVDPMEVVRNCPLWEPKDNAKGLSHDQPPTESEASDE